MTIRSDPPGALVLLDGREVGYTPFTTDFIYYGTREITLIKPGFKTLTTLQKVPPPWYQIPPLDFFSENVVPCKITNRQEFYYPLVPTDPSESAIDSLLNRAKSLRSETQVQTPGPPPAPGVLPWDR